MITVAIFPNIYGPTNKKNKKDKRLIDEGKLISSLERWWCFFNPEKK